MVRELFSSTATKGKGETDMNLNQAIDEAEHWLTCISSGIRTKEGKELRKVIGDEKFQKYWLDLVMRTTEPSVYVSPKGEIFFNENARKYAIESEVREAIELLIAFDLLEVPIQICLTNSMKELAEISPDSIIVQCEGEISKSER